MSKVSASMSIPLASFTITENAGCGECGMLVDPPNAFHPFLYCQLFKAGFMNPARFLEGQHFIPDPNHWGEGSPAAQTAAAESRDRLTTATGRRA